MKPRVVYKVKSSGAYVKMSDNQDLDGYFKFKILRFGNIYEEKIPIENKNKLFDQILNTNLAEEVSLEIKEEVSIMSDTIFKSLFPNFPHGQDAEVIIKSLINFQQLHLAIAIYGTVDTYDILKEFRFNVKFEPQFK